MIDEGKCMYVPAERETSTYTYNTLGPSILQDCLVSTINVVDQLALLQLSHALNVGCTATVLYLFCS
jgi:hypothetical protein